MFHYGYFCKAELICNYVHTHACMCIYSNICNIYMYMQVSCTFNVLCDVGHSCYTKNIYIYMFLMVIDLRNMLNKNKCMNKIIALYLWYWAHFCHLEIYKYMSVWRSAWVCLYLLRGVCVISQWMLNKHWIRHTGVLENFSLYLCDYVIMTMTTFLLS